LVQNDEPAVGPVITVISGTAGAGKTALALHWAHRVANHFPDGQLYVNLRGFDPAGAVTDSGQAIRGFLDALHVPPREIAVDANAQAAQYRSLVADKRVLVVLDNARDTDQVRPLLPAGPACLTLVTSRDDLNGLVVAEGAVPMSLDLLTAPESRQLLSRRVGADRVAAERETVDTIITLCARLPLALAIVAARAATHPHFPLGSLAEELRHSRNRLDALSGGDPATDVRAVLSWSYDALTPDAARLFRLLGLHPGLDISAAAATSLAGLPLPQVQPLLARLAHAHLIVEHRPGRFTFHDLLRAYANALVHNIDSDDQRDSAIRRMHDYYLRTAYTVDGLLNAFRDPIVLASPEAGVTEEPLGSLDEALRWFTTEQTTLIAAVNDASAQGDDARTVQLAWALTTFLHRQGHWQDQLTIQHAAVTAARRRGDIPMQAYAHRYLGRAYTHLDRLDDAHAEFEAALTLHQQAGDHHALLHTLLERTRVWEQQGLYHEALHQARRALDLARATDDEDSESRAHIHMGLFLTRLGEYEQALHAGQQALPYLEQLRHLPGLAATLLMLGQAHHHLGHHPEAVACYRRALALHRHIHDRYEEAVTRTHLGETLRVMGDIDAARKAWQESLATFTDLHHPDAESVHTMLQQSDLSQPGVPHGLVQYVVGNNLGLLEKVEGDG
jgi:tetratricopeptide (TPR) repeat protein